VFDARRGVHGLGGVGVFEGCGGGLWLGVGWGVDLFCAGEEWCLMRMGIAV